MKKIGGRFLQELRGEVCKLFMHSPPKFLQVTDFKAPNSISAGALSQTPLGELTALPPDRLAGLKGAYF